MPGRIRLYQYPRRRPPAVTTTTTTTSLAKSLHYEVRVTPSAITKTLTYIVVPNVALWKKPTNQPTILYWIRRRPLQPLRKKFYFVTTTSLTKSLQYTLKLTDPALTKSLKYGVKTTPAAKTSSLKYTVKTTPAAKTKSLAYAVKTTPAALTKSLKYALKATPAALSKSLQYEIRTVPTAITKSLTYKVIPLLTLWRRPVNQPRLVRRPYFVSTYRWWPRVAVTAIAITKSLRYEIVSTTLSIKIEGTPALRITNKLYLYQGEVLVRLSPDLLSSGARLYRRVGGNYLRL